MKNIILLAYIICAFLFPIKKCLAQDSTRLNVLSASVLRNSERIYIARDSIQHRIFSDEYKNTTADYYNLAVCYSALQEIDSTCYYVQKCAEESNSLHDLILTDTDFDFLHNTGCWSGIVAIIDSMYLLQYPDIEQKQVALQLYHILLKDQQLRGLGLKDKKIGADSVDIKNLAKVEAIIEEYGWPTFSMVGEKSALGAFMVIQHADVKTQRKYVKQVIDAAKINEASKESVALLMDRISVRLKGMQMFGTQVYLKVDSITGEKTYDYFPIRNEAGVDSMRKKMDLIPLKEYYAWFGIEYIPVSER